MQKIKFTFRPSKTHRLITMHKHKSAAEICMCMDLKDNMTLLWIKLNGNLSKILEIRMIPMVYHFTTPNINCQNYCQNNYDS